MYKSFTARMALAMMAFPSVEQNPQIGAGSGDVKSENQGEGMGLDKQAMNGGGSSC